MLTELADISVGLDVNIVEGYADDPSPPPPC
jgi:hypothetical protein